MSIGFFPVIKRRDDQVRNSSCYPKKQHFVTTCDHVIMLDNIWFVKVSMRRSVEDQVQVIMYEDGMKSQRESVWSMSNGQVKDVETGKIRMCREV